APFVDDVGVHFAVTVLVGNHFATTGEPDVRAVVATVVVLELLAVSASLLTLDPATEPGLGEPGAAPHLDVVAPREIQLLVVEPPGHVHVHPAHAVVIVGDGIHHFGHEPADV